MALYNFKRTPSSPTGKPHNPDRHHRADFARGAVFVEFGYRHGRALDYGDFIDRLPNELPVFSPTVRLK